jgi:hypothetical protein
MLDVMGQFPAAERLASATLDASPAAPASNPVPATLNSSIFPTCLCLLLGAFSPTRCERCSEQSQNGVPLLLAASRVIRVRDTAPDSNGAGEACLSRANRRGYHPLLPLIGLSSAHFTHLVYPRLLRPALDWAVQYLIHSCGACAWAPLPRPL